MRSLIFVLALVSCKEFPRPVGFSNIEATNDCENRRTRWGAYSQCYVSFTYASKKYVQQMARKGENSINKNDLVTVCEQEGKIKACP